VTERLYYHDSYLTRFRAGVVDANPDRTRVYLDRTAFYPTSGGQHFDTGALGGAAVIDVIDEGERIAHVTASPVTETEVEGVIDRARRFDHMRQHTGQHLLSAVFIQLLDAPTVGFHLGAEACTIDIQRDALTADAIRAVEKRANEVVLENRAVTVEFREAAGDLGLRKPADRAGGLRIVGIADLDRSACGGTHVRWTGEIGPILIRKLDRIRGIVRVEFLCGMRAALRARADFEALAAVSRVLSCPFDEAPLLVAAQQERLQSAEKTRTRLAAELARIEGRELWRDTPPRPSGRRIAVRAVPAFTDDLRALALSFIAGPASCFIAVAGDPPGILLATSADSGIHAGNVLKAALAKHGGRGGGNAALAQGSGPSKEALEKVRAEVEGEMEQGE
jgi:alanyl-tRNA synthetase